MKKRGSLLLLYASFLLLGACHKRAAAPVPPVPAPPDEFQLAERQFDAGDYAAAAPLYDRYLLRNPTSDNKEKALFRLALAHAVPGSAIHDLPQTVQYLKRLLALAPQSAYRTEAQIILGLYADLEKARAENRIKEGQIRTLNSELEKLKKIDLQKRPPRPPD